MKKNDSLGMRIIKESPNSFTEWKTIGDFLYTFVKQGFLLTI